MDKEKEIAKITKALAKGGLLSESYNKSAARVLVEAGYRRMDEVSKETAKELLDKLLVISPLGYEQLKAFVRVREQEYGIEVE